MTFIEEIIFCRPTTTKGMWLLTYQRFRWPNDSSDVLATRYKISFPSCASVFVSNKFSDFSARFWIAINSDAANRVQSSVWPLATFYLARWPMKPGKIDRWTPGSAHVRSISATVGGFTSACGRSKLNYVSYKWPQYDLHLFSDTRATSSPNGRIWNCQTAVKIESEPPSQTRPESHMSISSRKSDQWPVVATMVDEKGEGPKTAGDYCHSMLYLYAIDRWRSWCFVADYVFYEVELLRLAYMFHKIICGMKHSRIRQSTQVR